VLIRVKKILVDDFEEWDDRREEEEESDRRVEISLWFEVVVISVESFVSVVEEEE
jgi:hypothetical protein